MSQLPAEIMAVDQPLVGMTTASQPLGGTITMVRSINLMLVEMV